LFKFRKNFAKFEFATKSSSPLTRHVIWTSHQGENSRLRGSKTHRDLEGLRRPQRNSEGIRGTQRESKHFWFSEVLKRKTLHIFISMYYDYIK
jgi:hypothetical protein